MKRWLLRSLAALGVLAVGGLVACRFFWPEHLAVNAPLRNLVFGTPGSPPSDEVFEQRIRARDELRVETFARVRSARFLRPTPTGDVPCDHRATRMARDCDSRSFSRQCEVVAVNHLVIRPVPQ